MDEKELTTNSRLPPIYIADLAIISVSDRNHIPNFAFDVITRRTREIGVFGVDEILATFGPSVTSKNALARKFCNDVFIDVITFVVPAAAVVMTIRFGATNVQWQPSVAEYVPNFIRDWIPPSSRPGIETRRNVFA